MSLKNNPFASNNGLRATGRTCQSISLSWQDEPDEDKNVAVNTDSLENEEESNIAETEESLEDNVEVEAENDGNWYHVEMRKGQGSSTWETIYKGYSTHCEINGLPPDTTYIFRLKQNFDEEWGSEISASTETLPPSIEDLNRAVEMHSDYLVSRILKLTRPSYLKRLLHARDRNGMTTLMVASQIGIVVIVEKLISMGSDINALSSGSLRTPLMFACMMGHQNVGLFLDRNGAHWKFRDKCGCSAMDYSINSGNLALVKLAFARLGQSSLSERDICGWTPLMRATIISENLEVLRFLVRKGANVNDNQADKEKTPLMAAILAKKVTFIRYLLENGADPLTSNAGGINCVQIARGLQLREISEILAKHLSACEDSEEGIKVE